MRPASRGRVVVPRFRNLSAVVPVSQEPTTRSRPGSYTETRMTRVYDEIVDFIAGGTTPAAVATFQPSNEARERVADLLERERLGALTADEQADLAHYLELEHIMRLAKARARGHGQ